MPLFNKNLFQRACLHFMARKRKSVGFVLMIDANFERSVDLPRGQLLCEPRRKGQNIQVWSNPRRHKTWKGFKDGNGYGAKRSDTSRESSRAEHQGSRKHLQPQRDKGPSDLNPLSLQLERINDPNILEYPNNNWSSGITKAVRNYLRMADPTSIDHTDTKIYSLGNCVADKLDCVQLSYKQIKDWEPMRQRRVEI